jgi:cytochrome c553
MRLIFILLGGALCGAVAAVAQPASSDVITQKAAQCAGCHGSNGVPASKEYPVIWGQHAGYIFLELRDFKTGARKSAIMGPIANALTREDMLALGEYFEKKPWPDLGQPRAGTADASRAAADISSGQCTQCHLGGFLGDSTNPRLADQSVEYLRATMLAFHDGTRGNNPWMAALLKTYSAQEITALAQYLGGL